MKKMIEDFCTTNNIITHKKFIKKVFSINVLVENNHIFLYKYYRLHMPPTVDDYQLTEFIVQNNLTDYTKLLCYVTRLQYIINYFPVDTIKETVRKNNIKNILK